MMNESKFSVTKGARIVVALLALLLALAALQSLSAKPAEAGPNLGGAMGSGYGCPYYMYQPSLTPTSPVTWYGTDGDEIGCGGTASDRLDGRGGMDRIWGLDGNDTLIGGSGYDGLDGGNADDVISPDAGADVVYAGAGNDTIIAPADGQQDEIHGGFGTDVVKLVCGGDSIDIYYDVELAQRSYC
jgi:Ca2+-binding RTX toxin-like protein